MAPNMAPHPESARHTQLESLNQEFSGEVVTHPRILEKKADIKLSGGNSGKEWDSCSFAGGSISNMGQSWYYWRIYVKNLQLQNTAKCWCRVVSWAHARAKWLAFTLMLIPTHVNLVGDAIQPSHPLLAPSPPAFSLSQHHGLFQCVSSLHQVAKVLEFQLQLPSFQWIFRTDFL